jgi:3,4-dihydroxy 2-butanone 4-phosphate synthase/GTP cyclohydrolase II
MIMFHRIEEAIQDLQQGKVIIVVDDEDRENEGDFVALTEYITPETINFMVTHGRGLVCAPITAKLAQHLNLSPMTNQNTDPYGTAFTTSIDHITTTTGISAFERADTLLALTKSTTKEADFKQPGHIFPLIAQDGGVLKRPGHTEAAVDLATLSGVFPSGVICEILKEDGRMARVPDLQKVAEEFNLKIITIKDLITFRKQHDCIIKQEVKTKLATKYGAFKVVGYSNLLDEKEHLALVKGDLQTDQPILTRIHSECLTGDVFGSHRCDCGDQLEKAMQLIQQKGQGVILYMRQEGRDIGLFNKLRAYELQDQGLDTVEANAALGFPEDLREYYISAQMLRDLGVEQVELLTNNPRKVSELEKYRIHVSKRTGLQTEMYPENAHYLQTKRAKLGHFLTLEGVH